MKVVITSENPAFNPIYGKTFECHSIFENGVEIFYLEKTLFVPFKGMMIVDFDNEYSQAMTFSKLNDKMRQIFHHLRCYKIEKGIK